MDPSFDVLGASHRSDEQRERKANRPTGVSVMKVILAQRSMAANEYEWSTLWRDGAVRASFAI